MKGTLQINIPKADVMQWINDKAEFSFGKIKNPENTVMLVNNDTLILLEREIDEEE